MKYFIFLIMFSTLLGCSSSGIRAPVSDVTSSTKNFAITQKNKAPKVITFNGNYDTYQVKSGDTLYSIAWNLPSDVKTLAKLNNLKYPYTIYKGQLLNLKEDKPVKDKKESPKSKSDSQKILKKSQHSDQAQQKVKREVVLEKPKGYYSNTVDKNSVSQQKAIPKKVQAQPKEAQVQKVNSWSWPAKGKVVESFSGSQAGMKGISIANQRGTAIYATTDGQVVYAGSGLQGYGNLIIIKHNYDYLSAYANNEKLLVSENELVKEGQKIAIMGDSGTDSVHLHFEIRYRGKSVDPLRYLDKR